MVIVAQGQAHGQLSIGCISAFDGPIMDVAGDIGLMRALRPGTSAALVLDHGPLDAPIASFSLTNGFIEPSAVDMLDALRIIQQHTTTVVKIPAEVTRKDWIELIETAALLEGIATTGDMRTTTSSVQLPSNALGTNAPQDVFGDHFALGVCCSAGTRLDLPHQSIQLTEELRYVRFFRTARVATITDATEGRMTVALEPGTIPIWIDQRIDRCEDYTDALHSELLTYNAHIRDDDLIDQLAERDGSSSE